MVLAVMTGCAGLLAGLLVGVLVGRNGARNELREVYELLGAVGYDNERLRNLLARELRS